MKEVLKNEEFLKEGQFDQFTKLASSWNIYPGVGLSSDEVALETKLLSISNFKNKFKSSFVVKIEGK